MCELLILGGESACNLCPSSLGFSDAVLLPYYLLYCCASSLCFCYLLWMGREGDAQQLQGCFTVLGPELDQLCKR